MAFNYTLPLRLVQALFAIIVLGLTSYVTSLYEHSPSQNDFLLFTSIWTLLALAYLIVAPARFPRFAHKFAILGVEAVTMLFWFAGFVAAAVWVDRGWGCAARGCRTAQAAVVFGALEWLLFTATTTMAALHVWRTRNTQNKTMDPNMQVHSGV